MTTIERFRLDGKVAVVTGGGGAIGQVYGRALAEAGAAVVLADLNADGAEHAAAALVDDGLNAKGVRVDITERESTVAMAERTVVAFGGIDPPQEDGTCRRSGGHAAPAGFPRRRVDQRPDHRRRRWLDHAPVRAQR